MRRVRVTMTLEADPDIALFRWLLAFVVHAHATSPAPVRFRVEVLRDE